MCLLAVSRSTVSKTLSLVLNIIVDKLGVSSFPVDNPDKLEELAQGFRSKSCGQLFSNVVGAFDGYLLRISRKCLHKQPNASKYFCPKQFWAINCQVGCDSERRVTYLSIMCPGATPDILAHCAGPLHGAILSGQLDKKWQFVGDAAFPAHYDEHPGVFLIPYTRSDLRDPETRQDRDSFNYYLSQIRIIVECCFGMIVSKFRVLSRPLETTSLKRAVLTFQACCALHNFLINCRIAEGKPEPPITSPRGCRLVQRPDTGTNVDVQFVEVPTVDNECVMWTQTFDKRSDDRPPNVPLDPTSDRKCPTREEMVDRVAKSGYIRPHSYGRMVHPYVHY